MSVLSRILLWVNITFLAALFLSLALLMRQGREDLQHEQLAMKPVVETLIATGKAPELLALVGTSLRHVRVLELAPEPSQVPEWFQAFFRHSDQAYQLAFTGSDGSRFTLAPDDSDEIEEVWQSALALFWLFVLGGMLTNLAIWLGVRSGLRSLTDILSALDAVEKGDLDTRLGRYSLPEANAVAAHFNDMADALEQTQGENRQLTRELMTIRENERAALARDLHDGLGQYLTGLRAQTWMIPLKAGDKTGLEELAFQIGSTCEALDQGFRHLIRSQYPVALEQTGLKAAVSELLKEVVAAQQQIALTVSGNGWDNWPLATQAHLYRLIQEALNNSVRHADPSRINIGFSLVEEGALLVIEDDGRGKLPFKKGFGLKSMNERALMLGGTFQIGVSSLNGANKGSGTAVSVKLPKPDLP